MDARLLDYYNRELAYLRELGAEFAQAYPKIAGRLGMRGIEVADPYVERLLEGFSFLSARVQLKMDAEFPRFTQRLLELVFPNYVSPTPSMAIVQVQPNLAEGSLVSGFTVPRGVSLKGRVSKGEQTACEFRTAHPVTLWPLELESAAITGAPPDLPLGRWPLGAQPRSALRLRLKVTAAVPISQLALDALCFYLAGTDDIAWQLYELIMGHTIGVAAAETGRAGKTARFVAADGVRPEGFEAEQALFPFDARSFHGHRLLQEYFAFPARYQFFSLTQLQPALRQLNGNALELILLFDRPAAELERVVDVKQFALFCTPAINLFPKRTDRIAVETRSSEYHVVADRTRPLDYEVYSVTAVTGHMADGLQEREFRPLYASYQSQAGRAGDHEAYFTVRREPRVVSEAVQRRGPRTGYLGTEAFVSLVDRREAPFDDALRQLSIETWCTNRDLALLLPLGGASDFSLTASAPAIAVKVLRGPSRPTAAVAEREMAWRLINHLGLNYLSLTDVNPEQGAQALRDLLNLYAEHAQGDMGKHIEGLSSIGLKPITRRLPGTGPIAFGRGIEVSLRVDETPFGGVSPYLFGAVLEAFFARHVSLNLFTETVLSSEQRGEIARWKPRLGRRPAI